MEPREMSVEDAVRAALAAQSQDPENGYGLAFEVGPADCFVQWVRAVDARAAPAALEALEVKSEGAEPLAEALTAQGFGLHSVSDLAEMGMWEVTDPALMRWADEEELVTALAQLVRLLGGCDDQAYSVYP